jgi:hypothetical protein
MSTVSISTRYVLIASMDVTPEVEPLFNEVYDTEHVPNLLQVPGVRSVTRMKGEPARFAIAGAVRELPAPSPIYTAIYEIDDPQVLQSPEWAEAVERGGGRAKCARTLRTGSICYSKSSKPAGLADMDDGPLVGSRGHTPCWFSALLRHCRAFRPGSA